MNTFDFHLPTHLKFGRGQLSILGEEVIKLGKRAMVVTYPSKSLEEPLARTLESLNRKGVSTVVFDEITPNPTHISINKGSKIARQEQVDVVIGLGGGTPMDAAKMICVAAPLNKDIWEIFENDVPATDALTMVAIPTTAGSGSESTHYAVLSNRALNRKEGFARPQFYPKLSILDPLLTHSLSPRLTAETGMDALTHAIEAYTSKLASPISDLYAAKAIHLVGTYLRRAVNNGKDDEARSNMLLANTLAGIAITHADTCLAHVIGEAVGAVFNTGHGVTVSIALPAVMEFNCLSVEHKYASICRLLGGGATLSDREAARHSPQMVRTMLADLDLPAGLERLGVSESDVVTALVNRPGTDSSNPRPADNQAFATLIKGSLSPAMSYWEAGGK